MKVKAVAIKPSTLLSVFLVAAVIVFFTASSARAAGLI